MNGQSDTTGRLDARTAGQALNETLLSQQWRFGKHRK